MDEDRHFRGGDRALVKHHLQGFEDPHLGRALGRQYLGGPAPGRRIEDDVGEGAADVHAEAVRALRFRHNTLFFRVFPYQK